MRHDLPRNATLVTASLAIGWIGWMGQAMFLPAACAFPLVWSNASNRATAALVSAAYFLAASRGLPQGVATFYASDVWPGLLLWLLASASFVAVHTLAWTNGARPTIAARYLLALALTAMPPFGITGWAHPVTAAGVLFPGWGWWGLAATTAGLMGLISRIGPVVAIALGGFWLWSAATWTEPKVPEGWHGVDLEMGASLGRVTSLHHHRDLIATVLNAARNGARFVVLPESTLGLWTPTIEQLWRSELSKHSVTVIAGASVIGGFGYDNVLVAMNRHNARVFHQRSKR